MNEFQGISVLDYHQRTKHRFEGFAKGPGSIDWDAQPNPFRQFEGAPLIQLPLSADTCHTRFADLFEVGAVSPVALTLATLAQLLEMSLAISAWKEFGAARWSLRCNPSSGNLHPTETYLAVRGIGGLEDGVYHYRADLHSLELRNRMQPPAAGDSPLLLLGFTSVHWREAWKYGERAFRYCQLDMGHALAAVDYASATLGWSTELLTEWTDDQLARLLGIDRDADYGTAEREVAEACIRINVGTTAATSDPESLLGAAEVDWVGKANVLDRRHFYKWPIIDAIAAHVVKPQPVAEPAAALAELPAALPSDCYESAANLFRWRRSAQAFDGRTGIPLADFYRLLDHLLPRSNTAPWQGLAAANHLHLILFVHRVQGLKPGLYAFPRRQDAQAGLRAALNPQFLWNPVPDTPMALPLYELVLANAQKAAAKLSCQQAIAGDSAFSLAMLAEFDSELARGPWRYRELYWEAGAIGQVLYLEAEACGLRGTGIGCFFDDGVHELLGIADTTFQSLYHFTVGGPVQDQRIITLPPYPRARR